MNVALAHHWLTGMRGGEKVLEQFSALLPGAPIYTLVARPEQLSDRLRAHPLRTSFLQGLPGGVEYYRMLMPLFPWAARGLRVEDGVDFLLSTDASVIKGLSYGRGIPHVCYCHSPPRYLWDMQETYLGNTANLGPLGKLVFRATAPMVRRFDREAARRVSHFIANSNFVRERIENCYGRDATVIYPPVALDDFEVGAATEDFYLIVSELTPYKRVDVAVEAFNRLGKRLVVIGRGSELERLKTMAGPTVELLGPQPFAVLKRSYETCRAFVFPGIEDFGITPLEAQAAGRPVIGLARGGLLETTVEGKTAVYFHEQTPEALAEAVRRFEGGCLDDDPQACRAQAQKFSAANFRAAIRGFLTEKYPALFAGYAWGDA